MPAQNTKSAPSKQPRAGGVVTFAPSQLAGLKYFVAALIASFTLEAIGVGLHQTVHNGIHLFHRLPLVLEGFRSLPLTQLFLAFYLVLTLIRYLAAMLGASPLFEEANTTVVTSRWRVLIALIDTLLLYLSLTLLFIASLSAQDPATAIETAVWIVLTLVADAIICIFWILVLALANPPTIGFTDPQASRAKRFNKRWLGVTVVEGVLWYAFILIEQNGGGDMDRLALFGLLFVTLVIDFVASREFWVQILTGEGRR